MWLNSLTIPRWMAHLLFYQFKRKCQRFASFIPLAIFTFKIWQQKPCSHEGLLHYWFNPLHWWSFNVIDILYLEIKIMYTQKMSVHYVMHRKWNRLIDFFLRCEITVLEIFCILQQFKHTNAEKRNVLKHQSKSNMGMYVMCQIRYYCWMLLIRYWK